MKRFILFFIVMLSFTMPGNGQSQEWMTTLDAAKRLALVQDKMIFMMWEASTLYPLPVVVNDSEGNIVLVENLFENEELNNIIWKYFVPVKVSESQYAKLLEEIDGQRSSSYIDQFNDDFIKIMDANGNIVNTEFWYEGQKINFTNFISRYALDTSFLKQELLNYNREKDVNSSFRLATQYIDYAALTNESVRQDIINLSAMYLDEAYNLLPESDIENKQGLEQRLDLLKIKQELVLNHPKKVLRQLKRIDTSEIEPINQSIIAFLYFTAYLSLGDENKASEWRSEVSLVNLEKATIIINNNLGLHGNHN